MSETQRGAGVGHGEWLTVDERRRAFVARLDRMSPEERLRAARHEFDRDQRAIWAGRYPEEVPTSTDCGDVFVLQFSGGDPPVGEKARHRRKDVQHAVDNAMSIDDRDDDTRLYLGPARDAELLEVVTIVRAEGSELAIHAMPMRPTYLRLLPGE